MQNYEFDDMLTGTHISCSFPGLETVSSKADLLSSEQNNAESIFFPGCSFLNYALPLVSSLYELLLESGSVQGVSLLCCGKILQFEANANSIRPAFEQQFREHIKKSEIKRIVAACPNCVMALRGLLACDAETSCIEVVPLVNELIALGYSVDVQTALDLASTDERLNKASQVRFSIKDTCPDRDSGEFARGLRQIMPTELWVEPLNCYKRSLCCGSRPRAAGKLEAAYKSCMRNHEEAQTAGAQAIVTPCMSCTYLLSTLVRELPVFHYLELLFNYRINWEEADHYMKLRFLFDSPSSKREFYGLDASD